MVVLRLIFYIEGVILYLFAFILSKQMKQAKTNGYLKKKKPVVLLTPIGKRLNKYSLSWYSYSIWGSVHVALGRALAV